ncbi:OsmC family protein [Crossiella sp. CA-258035]|uniref:OsmC family protein n=1 Tax=Crossiella sp. CA-258035 TaxID=2981138 RepID=UPI0024BC1006|nr:OsmC family protein [Crossiella sp. CA-258035]WHT21795.1 OsmC family protein [Crossiella sp. CA-258035]
METIEPTPLRRGSATTTDGGRAAPEQLHAEALAACLWHAIAEAAGRLDLNPGKYEVRVESQIANSLNGEYSVEVVAKVDVPGLDERDRHRLIREADRLWPYTSGNWGRIAIRVGMVEQPAQ